MAKGRFIKVHSASTGEAWYMEFGGSITDSAALHHFLCYVDPGAEYGVIYGDCELTPVKDTETFKISWN